MPTFLRGSCRPSRRALLDDEHGATLMEYGLIALLVTAVCIAAVTATGQSVQGMWQLVRTELARVLGG